MGNYSENSWPRSRVVNSGKLERNYDLKKLITPIYHDFWLDSVGYIVIYKPQGLKR